VVSHLQSARQKEYTKEHTMTNKQQDTTTDLLYFDGSAEPNPGGRMGAGWRLVFTDRPEETGASEWPAARDNTNNRAEYLALIGALTQYLASGRSGPLLVQGDSQLVINQMTGDWGISNLALMSLNQQATTLVKRIAGGVRYRWIPREENQVADTLAGGQPALAGTPSVYAEHPDGASVATALAEQIARLNQAGKMSFKEAMGLRVGGMDQYSRWHLPELVNAVGAAGVALIDAAFPGQAPEAMKARETALRWMVRGLAAQLAIRKVQVDLEVQANRRPNRAP
jgi:ribonuclease HI